MLRRHHSPQPLYGAVITSLGIAAQDEIEINTDNSSHSGKEKE